METGGDQGVLGRTLAPAPRVLVAEDDPASQRLLEIILTSLGYRVRLAANGLEAVQALQATPCDIVLMELEMPMLDGFAATRQIRSLPEACGEPPIIGLTVHAGPEVEAAARAAGMSACLGKPLDVTELTETVAAWAGRGPRLSRAAASR